MLAYKDTHSRPLYYNHFEAILLYILYSTFDFSPISRQYKVQGRRPSTFYCLEIGEKSKVLYNMKLNVVLYSAAIHII